jgi:putative DNA primase/helicase
LSADPETASWYKEKGNKRQLQRIWNKAESAASRDLPVVNLGGRKLPINIDDAEKLLIQHDRDVFQRGDMIVRPAKEMVAISDHRQALSVRMVPIRATHLADRLTRIIDFKRYDARSEEWISVNCPPELAAAYLERIGEWQLPILTGIIDAPTLRPDGSILEQPGYDEATGILYAPSGSYYAIGSNLTKERARDALNELCKLLSGFPFVDTEGNDATDKPSPSRSVALSAILTAIIRRSITHAPLHAFTAPVMGSGKSKLVDIASMIATGHEAPVLSQGKTEEEMEKRLGAALIAGDALISFDNCEAPLGGELLCQALTQRTLKVRPLGKSMLVSLPTDALFAATGNNLIVSGDMTRRTILGTLDPKVERPELRDFEADPIEDIRADRALYVAAALTVLRAYADAGMPAQTTKPLGSFGDWSRKVRNALIWLDEPDPCLTMERARTEDPQTQALVEALAQWNGAIGSHGVTVKRAIEYATKRKQKAGNETPKSGVDLNAPEPPEFENPDFREALIVIAGDHGAISSLRLAKWLSRNKGKIVNGLRIEPDPTVEHGGAVRWRVCRA